MQPPPPLQRIDYVSLDRFRDQLQDPVLSALYDYWKSRCGPNDLFLRTFLDPIEIKELLPNVFIMDAFDSGKRFRYRLVGTYIQERLGRKITGREVEEVRTGALASHLITLFGTTIRTGKPGLGHSALPGESSTIAQYSRLALPMSSDGENIDQLLGGWVSTYESPVRLTAPTSQETEEPGLLIFAS